MTKWIVIVENQKWGYYQKEFQTSKEAKQYIESICSDMNTYCSLYKLQSINLEKVENVK